MIPTDGLSYRRSRVLDYVITNPFSTLYEIHKKSRASKNWEDVKADLEYFTKHNTMKKRNWWASEVYFVPRHLEPFQTTTANHLLLKDAVSSLMESNEQISKSNFYSKFVAYYGLKGGMARMKKGALRRGLMVYKWKINSGLLPFEQILRKLVIMYILKVKILLMEYSRNKKFGDYIAIRRKELREGQIVNFLANFRDFLSRYGEELNFHSRVFSSFKELSDDLNRDHREDIEFYNKLLTNRLYAQELLSTFLVNALETKKDASQKSKISMKQIGNRIKLFHGIGEKEYERWYRLLVKESAHAWINASDISLLMDRDFLKADYGKPTVYHSNRRRINKSNKKKTGKRS